jgi:hypothetical protein
MIDKFNRVSTNSNEFKIDSIRTFVPNPTDLDYKRGYITRYFVQRVNDVNSYIYETDSINFLNYSSSYYFRTTKLDWKISGTIDEVKILNEKSIRFASSNMKSLKFYLPNLLQFHKK